MRSRCTRTRRGHPLRSATSSARSRTPSSPARAAAARSDSASAAALVLLVQLGEPELGVSLLPDNWKWLAQLEGVGFTPEWFEGFEVARQTLGDETFEHALARAEATERPERVQQTL